jgi:radical SAM superfamily enzyme YgiQ (UPF0313 family)
MGAFYRGSPLGFAVTCSPPLGLASMAAAARLGGHEVRVLDLETEAPSALSSQLHGFHPDIVGIHLKSPMLAAGRQLARTIERLHPRALRIAGGPHPSACAEDVVADGLFHVAVVGEGEGVMASLLDDPEAARERRVLHASQEQDLDLLPFPAFDLFDLGRYRRASLVAPGVPVADLESSRGCEGTCPYCSRVVMGRRFRAKSVERVIEEVERAQRAGFQAFNFVDDSFSSDFDRAMRICESLRLRGSKLPWTFTNGLRVDQIRPGFLHAAARAGCRLVALGLESGNERILAGIGKDWGLDRAKRVVREARDEGLVTLGYFMLGLPEESLDSMRDTLRFAVDSGVDLAKFSLLMPLPGTTVYRSWAGRMRRPLPDSFSIHRPAPDWFQPPSLSWREIESARRTAYATFYLRPSLLGRLTERRLRWMLKGLLRAPVA